MAIGIKELMENDSSFSSVIHVKSVSKTYPGRGNSFQRFLGIKSRNTGSLALDSLDLSIQEGEFYGLLGMNGAGKTTLIKILSGILRHDSGSIRVFGQDIFSREKYLKKLLGVVMGGDRSFYWKLTASENLEFFASIYGLSRREARIRTQEVLEYVGLLEKRNEYVETFSKGMKQRLLIAKALIHSPKILLFDEPTVGLDVESASVLRKQLKQLNTEKKVTVILTTHYLFEAEQLCSRVGIINRGKIIKEGTHAELSELINKADIFQIALHGEKGKIETAFSSIPNLIQHRLISASNAISPNRFEITLKREKIGNPINGIFKALDGFIIDAIEKKVLSLEDVFLSILQADRDLHEA